MAMLLGPANGSIMVRYVLDVCEGALFSNHTIPTLSLFLVLSTNIVKIKCYVCCKWFKQDDCTFFSGRNFSGGSKNIASQMTVPFFLVVIFSGCNWCSYFDTNTNYGTYNRKK
jgi:hypothetical protein